MTVEELDEILFKLKDQKLSYGYFQMDEPNFSGRNYPERVRSPFGLVKWYPSNKPGIIFIYPTVKQIEGLIWKLKSQP